MSYWLERKIVNGKVTEGWRVYLGCDSCGKVRRKRVKTEAEAKALDAKFRKNKRNTSEFDDKFFRLPYPVKAEVITNLEACARAGVNLTDAVLEYLKTHNNKGVTVSEASARYVKHLESCNLRSSYKINMGIFMSNFCRLIGEKKIPTITTDSLRHIYKDVSLRSKSTWRTRVSVFFNWCVKNDLCPSNPAEKLDAPIVERKMPRVLTVFEVEKLLKGCPKKYLGALVLMLFAGVRPAEARQVKKDAISLQARSLIIGSHIAKTRSFRVIDLCDTLLDWLAYAFDIGAPFPAKVYGHVISAKFASVTGLYPWPRDCLRHTAASMMLARDKNADSVALELGNSPTILHRHYKNLVSPADCTAFWAMTPKVVGRRDLSEKDLTGYRVG